MLQDIGNTGDDHLCASSGVRPSRTNLSCGSSSTNIDDEDGASNDDDSESEEASCTSARVKRSRGSVGDT
jgi:hypothetical protein